MVAANDPASSGVIPGLYADTQATAPWFGWAQDGVPPSGLSAGQGGLAMNNQVLSNPYLADDLKQVSLDKDMQSVMPRQNISRDEVSFSGASGLLGGSNDLFTPISSYGRSRSGSFDFGSDSSSASQSIPSSAASSSINLPLDVSSRQQQPVYHVGTEIDQQYSQLILLI